MVLADAGFEPPQIHTILTLPDTAWHKSWWYPVAADGSWGLPFQRCLRSRHSPHGTYTLQYRDYFAQERPVCFHSQMEQVLLHIYTADQRFSDVLAHIHRAGDTLGLTQAILLSPSFPVPEAQGFLNQGVHLYNTAELN